MTQPLPHSALRLWFLYWLKDHGALRAVWTNFHKVDAEVWRHNHPSPARLAQLQALGAASILTLRGDRSVPSLIELDAAARLDLPVQAIAIRATVLPQPQTLLDLLQALRQAPKPVVIHCKSGADRTGLASVLYLHVIKGLPLAEARGQLALRFAHNRFGSSKVLHVLLDAYAADHARLGIGFEDWVRDHYDPAALKP